MDKDDALVLKLIEEIVKIISEDHVLAVIATLGLLYLFAQAVAAPAVAWYTARRQHKVDKGQTDLSKRVDSGQSVILERLDRLDKTINGDPDNGRPAAVERVIDGQARILERLERLESADAERAQDVRETRADVRALRDGQREILTEVRSQLAYHSDAVEKLLAMSRHQRKSKRTTL